MPPSLNSGFVEIERVVNLFTCLYGIQKVGLFCTFDWVHWKLVGEKGKAKQHNERKNWNKAKWREIWRLAILLTALMLLGSSPLVLPHWAICYNLFVWTPNPVYSWLFFFFFYTLSLVILYQIKGFRSWFFAYLSEPWHNSFSWGIPKLPWCMGDEVKPSGYAVQIDLWCKVLVLHLKIPKSIESLIIIKLQPNGPPVISTDILMYLQSWSHRICSWRGKVGTGPQGSIFKGPTLATT